MGLFGLLADTLVLGATIKIMDNATEPMRERSERIEGGSLFDKW
jgi:hypothetical protein